MELVKKGQKLNEEWYGKCNKCHSIFKSTEVELSKIGTFMDGMNISPNGVYGSAFYRTSCSECNTLKSVVFYSKDSTSGSKIYEETPPVKSTLLECFI